MGHSYRTLLWDTLKGHSCETLLWDTVAGHSCGTLFWDTLVGHSCRDTVCPHTRSSHASVSYETSSKSHASRLQDERFVRDFLLKSRVKSPKRSVSYETSSKSHTSSLQNERFVRDFLQKSRVKSQKRAFRTRLPPKVTRQVSKTSVSYETSPKVTRQVSKTTVSYETSSKSHTSSLQNERFVRDFLQKSRCEAARRAFRTRLPPKVTRQVSKTSVSHETSSKSHTSSLQNERFVRDFLQKSSGNTHRSTHITQPCLAISAISRFQPLQTTPAHTPIPM